MNNKYNSLELQAEVLTGCAFKCAGCQVEINNNFKVTEKLYRVAEQFIARWYPFSFVLGSTDIFTASNAKDLLKPGRFRSLIENFDRLVVNSTLAKIDADIAEQLSQIDANLQINIVIPQTKFLSERYLEVIAGHLSQLREKIPEITVHPQINLTKDLQVDDYEALNNFYWSYFGQGVDFNLSFARTETNPEVYQRAFEWLKQVSSSTSASIDGSMKGQHVDVVNPDDSSEKAIIFYNNTFYTIPVVYEDLIQTHPKYQFEDYEEYLRLYDSLILEQYQYAERTTECSTCNFLPICAERRILSVMQTYDIKDCILPKDTIYKVNGWVGA